MGLFNGGGGDSARLSGWALESLAGPVVLGRYRSTRGLVGMATAVGVTATPAGLFLHHNGGGARVSGWALERWVGPDGLARPPVNARPPDHHLRRLRRQLRRGRCLFLRPIQRVRVRGTPRWAGTERLD
jgi:hypothetical protein